MSAAHQSNISPGTLDLPISNQQLTDRSVWILGVRVHRFSFEESLRQIGLYARCGKKHQVVTVNPEFIMEAQTNEAFRDVLNRSSLALPDGVGVLYASRMFGAPIRERVAGADIVESICEIAASRGFSIFLLGAADGVAEKTAEILKAKYPGLTISGTYAGTPDPMEEDEICRRINSTAPDFLFVAYGAPRQDLWISRNIAKLDLSVAMGVGGTFDFISGISSRAPAWIRRVGLEWLHRLSREPRRWRRMLALPKFALRCMTLWVSPRSGR